MNEQVHQRFSTEEMKTFLEEYLNDKTKLVYILEILKIKRTRFFELLRQYRRDPDNFSIRYKRKRTDPMTERFIQTTLESLSSMIPLIISSLPMLIRSGI